MLDDHLRTLTAKLVWAALPPPTEHRANRLTSALDEQRAESRRKFGCVSRHRRELMAAYNVESRPLAKRQLAVYTTYYVCRRTSLWPVHGQMQLSRPPNLDVHSRAYDWETSLKSTAIAHIAWAERHKCSQAVEMSRVRDVGLAMSGRRFLRVK